MATSKEIINGQVYYYKMIEIGYDSTGKRKREKIRAKTVKDLNAKIQEFMELKSLGKDDTRNLIFRDFMKNWLYNVHFLHLKGSTKEKYNGLYINYLKDSSICMLKMSNLNAIVVQNYYNELTKAGVTDSLIRNIHKLVRPCLTYAYANGYTLRDFGAPGVIKLPARKERSINKCEILTIEEQKKFIDSLEPGADSYLYLTALGTGLRLGELLALRWTDINLNTKELTVNKSVRRVKDLSTNESTIVVTEPKTANSLRTITLPDKIINLLETNKKEQKLLKLSLGKNYENNDLVFPTKLGKYQDSSNVRKRFKKALKKAEIKDIKFHALRHTFATRLFENNVPIKTVSSLLGHYDVSITMDIYTHVLEESKKDAAKILNNII